MYLFCHILFIESMLLYIQTNIYMYINIYKSYFFFSFRLFSYFHVFFYKIPPQSKESSFLTGNYTHIDVVVSLDILG